MRKVRRSREQKKRHSSDNINNRHEKELVDVVDGTTATKTGKICRTRHTTRNEAIWKISTTMESERSNDKCTEILKMLLLFVLYIWMVNRRSYLDILKSMPLSGDGKPKTKHSIRTRASHTNKLAFQEVVFVLLDRHICHLCCSVLLPNHDMDPHCLCSSYTINGQCAANTRNEASHYYCKLFAFHCIAGDFCLVKFLPLCHTENRQHATRLAPLECDA